MTEKTHLIVNASINENEIEAFNHYSQEVSKLFLKAGAKPLSKYKIMQSFIGPDSLHLVSILEFPSEETLKKVFNSIEYQELIPLRDKAFTKLSAYIA